eukprot:TRINITY_DN13739_c0_g1_i1.p1 TRINITY_DN13739_c0_g1~~TRINITY_DN13739_c0_g1_i1.p1  ORF type:complete len:766 (+),score=194.98 TRINITY_DN13739_c0_g1_i1:97-2394(+)
MTRARVARQRAAAALVIWLPTAAAVRDCADQDTKSTDGNPTILCRDFEVCVSEYWYSMYGGVWMCTPRGCHDTSAPLPRHAGPPHSEPGRRDDRNRTAAFYWCEGYTQGRPCNHFDICNFTDKRLEIPTPAPAVRGECNNVLEADPTHKICSLGKVCSCANLTKVAECGSRAGFGGYEVSVSALCASWCNACDTNDGNIEGRYCGPPRCDDGQWPLCANGHQPYCRGAGGTTTDYNRPPCSNGESPICDESGVVPFCRDASEPRLPDPSCHSDKPGKGFWQGEEGWEWSDPSLPHCFETNGRKMCIQDAGTSAHCPLSFRGAATSACKHYVQELRGQGLRVGLRLAWWTSEDCLVHRTHCQIDEPYEIDRFQEYTWDFSGACDDEVHIGYFIRDVLSDGTIRDQHSPRVTLQPKEYHKVFSVPAAVRSSVSYEEEWMFVLYDRDELGEVQGTPAPGLTQSEALKYPRSAIEFASRSSFSGMLTQDSCTSGCDNSRGPVCKDDCSGVLARFRYYCANLFNICDAKVVDLSADLNRDVFGWFLCPVTCGRCAQWRAMTCELHQMPTKPGEAAASVSRNQYGEGENPAGMWAQLHARMRRYGTTNGTARVVEARPQDYHVTVSDNLRACGPNTIVGRRNSGYVPSPYGKDEEDDMGVCGRIAATVIPILCCIACCAGCYCLGRHRSRVKQGEPAPATVVHVTEASRQDVQMGAVVQGVVITPGPSADAGLDRCCSAAEIPPPAPSGPGGGLPEVAATAAANETEAQSA